MNAIEALEQLSAATPEAYFKATSGREPSDSWVDQRTVGYMASALRNRLGTAARKSLPDLLKLARAVQANRFDVPDAVWLALAPLIEEERDDGAR